jgi:tetratricopeptide (TPR) repeat protein
MGHRFDEAKRYLEKIADCSELSDTINRLSLSIDQACGMKLEVVLKTRLRMAADSGRLEDLVPLGALYADLREFDEADRIYQRALREYQNTSPFPAAWVCFQLGALWGELVPVVQPGRARIWYQRAIKYLPRYVKARVHLAEIYLKGARAKDAEALLIPALSSRDPEVNWRLADVLAEMGRTAEADVQRHAARIGFEEVLKRHLLAFADHGAEFYADSGNDVRRAFELASINLANRPTLRAFELAYTAAIIAGAADVGSEILAGATKCWNKIKENRLPTPPFLDCKSTAPAEHLSR